MACKLSDQGRNEIRFNNSKGRTLLENWVEERAVDHIDPSEKEDCTSSAQLFKDGHHGLLTTKLEKPVDGQTTYNNSYTRPAGPSVRTRGIRDALLEQALQEQASREVHEEFNKPPEQAEYKSIAHRDYDVPGFVPTKQVPTAAHDYRTEQPVSFWTDHRDSAHGVTQTRPQFNSVFRKNSAFSKPIDEYWEPEEPKPYCRDHVPHM